MEKTFVSVAELSRRLQSREVSAVELARDYLERIEEGRGLNAFLDVRPEETIRQAEEADRRIAAGQATPLTGIPIAHKDIFVTKEWASTAASRMLEGYMSPFDATVVRSLKDAGMVCMGKLNCDEFAMGSGNENSAYGRVGNPWDANAVPGGSSGGSAAAVAAGLVPIATGTDTGGSIREPAAFCGITGMKPTYGRPSRLGMIAFASSLDTAGLLGQSAEDCAMVLGSMVGHDPWDSTSVDMPREDFSRDLGKSVKGLKIGVPRSWMGDGLDSEVRASIDAVLDFYRREGAEIVDIELPMAKLGVPVYYVVACAEASSNLSRFDGVRYGHRAAEYTDIGDMMKKSRDEGFGPEPKRRIMIGTYVLSHGYYDAYYLKAQKVRRLIAREFHETFRKVDAIACPVTTGTAYDFGANADPVSAYLSDLYTVPASLAGLPGVSMPCGIHSNGRPIGLQLLGEHFTEAKLLHLADAWQKATDWHQRHPKGY
ncbi:Asp-tRNA(Asn)/Glu-tRNA(Gln) amidotransferase subunit GatA [Sutterella faecalis]|uniref:Glutamyl-tRNA(Gln) amidotransferase subunit A n=2 Tax=Sutterella TaxID=40544 RepID=A0AAI9SDN9_9BURK|nr:MULTISPECIES: Asp-tRNA(Asn)/Glu-tRNA(Gln) amidotransferase subunit GatA [Sutterella]KAB7652645.1 Asp-tRNA(Asn)/Glu-tRNA(Gln) amidotransferase subunit GatA [Sutterella seckii]MBE5692479.1 Asp-tRNA(Asn)/Glu-tRNA(Gln) amidotransferase subunit GatA [Sutterella sp.]QDA54864.1 Asp-tRNA(Asn)/Glu-tRNA(Gln) amidotransferase subunit GatA [Sutterella faecalis]